jgi:hypothetical protein
MNHFSKPEYTDMLHNIQQYKYNNNKYSKSLIIFVLNHYLA